MSLRVWLPLNGNLNNQGLSNITVTNNGATVNNNGKIGKCYGINDVIDLGYSGSNLNTNSISLCCWVRFNTNDIASIINNQTYTSTYKSSNGNILGNNSYGGFSLQWYSNDIYTNGSFSSINVQCYLRTSTVGAKATTSINLPLDTWNHLCAICDKTTNKCSLYLNGVFQNFFTFNTFNDATDRSFKLNYPATAGGNYRCPIIPILYNDVRIYDHALSTKEIEEIAKGLVLHYKLDDTYSENTTNLCNNLKTGGRTTLSTNPLMITTTGENADTYWYVQTSSALVGGNTYTLSLQCSGLAPGEYFQFGIGAQSGANNCGNFVIYNGYNEKTFTLASGLNGVTQFILDDNSYSSGVRSKQISFYNVQLEAKDHATGYAGVGNSRGGQYDTNIYIEPDGSKWIRIAHHNNPTVSGYFSNSDTWTTGVYLSEDKWYAVDSAIAQVSVYEFMVKQKTTSSATETKYRWTQDKNPLIAVYNDVKPGTVTFNTSSGYTNSNYGGLWQMNSSARLCIANSSSGNWYGAFGCWTAYLTNQMPGFPNTTISTGYMDLYIRIDNTNLGIVYDCSGYGNNGTIIGSLETVSDSSRYSCATKFNGSSAIKVNDNNWMAQGVSDLTVNIWAYMDNWSNWNGNRLYSCTEGGGFNIENTIANSLTFPVCVYTNTAHSATGYIPTESRVAILKTDLTSGWHMFTYIYTETECQCYLDGVLYQTKPYTSYGVYFNINGSRLFLGCEANGVNPYSPYFIGQESDFRIYYTALTPEQIKELYNTSMSIDNNGNIHARELVEL